MTKHDFYLYQVLGGIICFLLLIGAFPTQLYSQENVFPYQLTEAVQVRAKELNIWNQVTNEFDTMQKILAYLNELTAADIMAQYRSEMQGKKAADNSDYDMMFASFCRFIPNKPNFEYLHSISKTVRMDLAKSELFLNNAKRSLLKKAMKSILLKNNLDTLYSLFAKVDSINEFYNNVFDLNLRQK